MWFYIGALIFGNSYVPTHLPKPRSVVFLLTSVAAAVSYSCGDRHKAGGSVRWMSGSLSVCLEHNFSRNPLGFALKGSFKGDKH